MTLNLGQSNLITFVMVDAGAIEVPGLGAGFALELSKNGAAFVPATGVSAEIGSGWYSYEATAGECDTVGTLSVKVNGAGCVQQNLEYVVESRTVGSVPYLYTVHDALLNPIAGVTVTVTTNLNGTGVVQQAVTNASGQVTFILDPGTYYFWSTRAGYSFVNPDTETVP